jgi:hypothetical protein
LPVLATWTAHPARRRPRDLALVVAVLALTMAVVLMSFESLLLALLAGAVILAAVAPFLLPTRYTVTDEGIEAARGLRRTTRRFADLRRVDVGGDSALLSPFRAPRRLDRYRGLVVFLDGADRERVVALLRERVRT